MLVLYRLAGICALAALLITFYTDVKLNVYTWLFINRLSGLHQNFIETFHILKLACRSSWKWYVIFFLFSNKWRYTRLCSYHISFGLSHVDICNKCVCLMNHKTSELYDRRWRKNAFKIVQYWIVFAVICDRSFHQLKSTQNSSSLKG